MPRLFEWLAGLLGIDNRVPKNPVERVKFRLDRMPPPARQRALALRRQAAEDLGGLEAADAWLAGPVPFLGNRRPIDIVHTKKGASAVELTLHNMRHGIYS